MTLASVRQWTAKHGWLLAFTAVVFGGYAVGKDAALRDNRQGASDSVAAPGSEADEVR